MITRQTMGRVFVDRVPGIKLTSFSARMWRSSHNLVRRGEQADTAPLGGRISFGAVHKFRFVMAAVLAGGLLQMVPAASAQIVSALKPMPSISAFATYTGAQPNSGSGSNTQLYGPTFGAFYQTSNLIGFEVRATATRYGGFNHQDLALGGVRLGVRRGRFAPYGAFLFGAAHARYPDPTLKTAKDHIFVGIGPAWQIAGGADYNLQHHLRIRLGEFSYSTIYMSNRNLTPWSYGSGLVFRFH
jgi:hypothetical protein